MSDPVRHAHEIADAFMAEAQVKSAEQGKPTRCSAGCFHCCREPVYVEKSEAAYLISGLSEEQRAEVIEKAKSWLAQFRAQNLHQARGRKREQAAESKDFTHILRYRAANLWCPFLKDGLCQAYDRRPTGCRSHFATGHPVRCEDDKQRVKQVFMITSRWPAEILGAIVDNAPTSLVEFDHLGVWLSILLLGETEQSAAAESIMIHQTDPS